MKYLKKIPAELPAGEVLVHNSVRPQYPLGRNGFRAWTQAPAPCLVPCDCNWPEAIRRQHLHYRIERASA